METETTETYVQPVYVILLNVGAWLCLTGALFVLILALNDVKTGTIGFILLGGGLANFFYSAIANDIGFSAWQTGRTAALLAPALEQIALLHAERETRTLVTTPAETSPKAPIREVKVSAYEASEKKQIYFILIAGQSRGPFSVEQFREFYAKGRVTLDQRTTLEGGSQGPTIDELLAI